MRILWHCPNRATRRLAGAATVVVVLLALATLLGLLAGHHPAAAATLAAPVPPIKPPAAPLATFQDASVLVPGLPQVYRGSVAWGDYDNDGRLDFLLTGYNNVVGTESKLYHNTASGFVDASGVVQGGLPPVDLGSVAWGDYDNDGRLDFLITGFTSAGTTVSKLYHNTGSGFVDASGVVLGGLPQVAYSSVAWGDYDNDGRLDFLITGNYNNTTGVVSKLYHNTGSGFADASSLVANFPQVSRGSVSWGDYDNDGRLDFLITGSNDTTYVSKLYRNTGSSFVDASGVVQGGLPQVYGSSVAWGDYDNDGRLDFLITGDAGITEVSKLYHNTGGAANTTPSAPSSLQAYTIDPSTILLQWQAASDGQTPALGLNYNLRVGTTPGGSDVVGPMADTTTGLRRLPWLGPAQATGRPLGGLTPGMTYYWSAQALDSALAGGPFAAEGSFVAGAQPTPVPSPTPTPCTINFSDVHPTDYFYTPVTYLYCHGVVSGYADGTFRPYTFTTRAQYVKFVILGFALPIQTPSGGQYTFTDVPPTAPQFDVVETAAGLGIVNGYACGGPNEPCDAQHRHYFRPHANVTRGQVAKIDVLAAGWPLLNPATGTFEDVLPGTAFYPFVETVACRGIMIGYNCGGPNEPCDPQNRTYFRPGNNATRGQLAKIVYLSLSTGYTCGP